MAWVQGTLWPGDDGTPPTDKTSHGSGPRAHKANRAKKPRKVTGHKAKTVRKARRTRPHEARAGVGETGARGGGVPVRAHASGSGEAIRQLVGHAGAIGGLSGAILELVGEGVIGVDQMLAAAQREQDRVTNRAWRRPGGLARMGGL
jgi:hypothetical protein